MRGFVARFNFLCTLIENRPQSLTGHTAGRLCVSLENNILQNYNLIEFQYLETLCNFALIIMTKSNEIF
jgi:hypothetical protein